MNLRSNKKQVEDPEYPGFYFLTEHFQIICKTVPAKNGTRRTAGRLTTSYTLLYNQQTYRAALHEISVQTPALPLSRCCWSPDQQQQSKAKFNNFNYVSD